MNLAQMVQQPFDKPGTSILITGEKRTGKDTVFDFFGKYVIGDDYYHNYTCGGEQFFEKHDTGRMNKFLCKIEEMDRGVFMRNSSKFKSVITAELETFNDKGKKNISVANHSRFAGTTNGVCPVDLGDGEERFLVAKCSSARKHDIPYWTEVRRVLFNKEAGRAVGHWLSTFDLSGVEFRRVPKDAFQTMIVESEKTMEEKFVEQWDGVEVGATALFDLCVAFCNQDDQKLPPPRNPLGFGKKLMRLVRDGKVGVRMLDGKCLYSRP